MLHPNASILYPGSVYSFISLRSQHAPRVNIFGYGKEGSIDGNNMQMNRMCSLLGNCGKIGELAISDSSLDQKQVQRIAEAVKNLKVTDCNKT